MASIATEWAWVRHVPYACPTLSRPEDTRFAVRQAMNILLPKRHDEDAESWKGDVHRLSQWSGSQWSNVSSRPTSSSSSSPSRPVLCYIHGGAWMSGHRHSSEELLEQIALSKGWAAVSIGYRICRPRSFAIELLLLGMCGLALGIALPKAIPIQQRLLWLVMALICFIWWFVLFTSRWREERNAFPTGLHDVLDALRWCTTYGTVLCGFDPRSILLCGHSAGAHLSSLVVFHSVWKTELWKQRCPELRIAGWIGISGLYSRQEMEDLWMTRQLLPLVFDDPRLGFVVERELEAQHRCGSPSPLTQWPDTLLLSAEYDYGLRRHSFRLAQVLLRGNANVRWYTIRDVNHLSIVAFSPYQHHRIAHEIADFGQHALLHSTF
jgi:hypothetical protein